MRSITLVLGGVRSGKSRYALTLAESIAGPRVFVATASASDEEMAAKIDLHRAERSSSWTTVEETTALGRVLREVEDSADVVVIDCLTMFAASVMEEHQSEVDDLIAVVEAAKCAVVLVSNEVGSGVVPEYASGRKYRDLLGEINQRVARIADDVVLMVAGIPLAVKGSVR